MGTDPQGIPFIAVGNDELSEMIGSHIKCYRCHKEHPVKYGEKVLPDGSRKPSQDLGFVRCDLDNNLYLVSIMGKIWKPQI